MRKYILPLVMTTAMALATPAMARGFDNTIETQITSPVKVEVSLSEDLAYRADNLPKKLSDRGSSRGLNDGFGGNGYYGERDLNQLTEYMEEKLAKRFEKQGIAISNDAPVILRVTLEDAKPNRPTFNQLGQDPGLSYDSVSLGGAEIKAELFAAGGESLGTMSYDYYETNFEDVLRFKPATWSDARRAISRFSSKAAKTISDDSLAN